VRIFAALLFFLALAGCGPPSHTPAPVEIPVVEKATYKARLGDRTFVASALRSVFKSDDASGPDDAAVETILTNLILSKSQFFGGSCQYYDSSACATTDREGDVLATSLSSSSSPREAFRLRACLALSALDGAAGVALGKAGLSLSSDGGADSADKVYALFFPAQKPAPEVRSHLVSNHAKFKAKYNSAEAWKLTLFSICLSPKWQQP
jgi:hypothetical protein